ncbi:MAG: hypothetical protein GY856_22780, partial [bacterium]|nr:hypothetical protein [bacterium]
MRLRDVLTLTLTLTLTLIVVLLSCPSISGLAAPEAGEAVAIVCWITGEATVERPTAAGVEPLAVLDRLAPGSVVRTAPASEVTVVFFDGRRFAIGAASRVAIRADDAQSEAGSVRILDPVPAVAELARLARSENPGKRPGAGRIRHTGTSDTTFELYPRDGAALLSAAAILRFTPIAGVEEYRVEVIDEADEEVFAVETAATEVPVPAGVLQPGIMYGWRVRSLDRGRLILHGEALFVTLSDQNARARRRLAERAADADDPGLRLLLAAIDRSLGLWRDACDGVLSVAARAPSNAAVHRALERFECSEWRSGGGAEAVDSGVVVEELGQGSTLERAGIQAGDLLLSWERPAQFPFDGPSSDNGPKARGEFESVFDWMWLVIEQAPRGRVLLIGERDGAPKLFEVPMGLWDVVEVRPRMRHA